MENINFNFEKFVKDIEQRRSTSQDENVELQRRLDAWEPRRRLNALYRENPHNRIYIKK